MKIILRRVRLSFPKLFKPEQVNGQGKPAYSAAFIIPADDEQVDEINNAIDKVAQEHWGAKASTILGTLRAQDRIAIHNGDTKADLDGYAGNYFINSRNSAPPLILDRDKRVLTETDGRPYGGCYVDCSLDLWAQDNQFGKRINATLKGVQFVEDGDAFVGGPPASPDEFEDYSKGDEHALA